MIWNLSLLCKSKSFRLPDRTKRRRVKMSGNMERGNALYRSVAQVFRSLIEEHQTKVNGHEFMARRSKEQYGASYGH